MSAYFIAEVSSNHHQDIARCLQFVDCAAAIGCDAVKFQLFRIDELFAPEILAKSAAHRERKQWELPAAFLPLIAKRCKEKNIHFSCTPFYLEAVEQLYPYVDFYKIASYELLWHDLLQRCAQTGKPVVLSTGMATLAEIQAAVRVLQENGCSDITLLHCISGYPTPIAECNLAAIQTLRQACVDCNIGWSDHSVSAAVLYRAIYKWNASMVEFHLDLEGSGEEFTTGHCWLPKQIETVITTLKQSEAADGDGVKIPVPSEQSDREWRADPSDGLRPLKHIREQWKG